MTEPPSDEGEVTVGQRLIWAGQQLSPDSPLYNMAVRADFSTALDPARFRSAFESVVDRSDALRAVFSSRAGALVQDVRPDVPGSLEEVDLSGEADPEEAARGWIEERVRRPLDLGRASYDTALLRLGPERWTWLFNQHHLATDAWSEALLYRLVGEAYAGADPSTPLPAFAEHVAFERQNAGTPSFARAREHWRARERSAGRPLRLYGRAARSDRDESRRIRAPLGPERMERLRRLAETDGVRLLTPELTLFSLLATSLVAWLVRVSGERIVTLGSPSHNRRTPRARATLGLFVEVFPLGVTLEEGETFRSLLGRVAEETRAFVLQGQPGASTPATVSLFNVVLNYLNVQFGPFGGIPARVEWVHPGASDPGHAVRVHVHDLNGTGELEVLFDVNTGLFEPEVAARLPRHWLRLLDALLADLDAVVERVPVALEDEVGVRLTAAPQGEAPPADDETVVSLFDGQAERTPEALALRRGETTVTYRELRARAEATARALVERGIGPGDRVGVHARRSVELVVAVLGILKAGAAYVPLEAGLPEQRLRLILEDTGARLVVVGGGQEPAIERAGGQTVAVAAAGDSPPGPAFAAVDPDSPAYVIYTSGSTGRPKGVVVEHRGLADYVRWAHRTFAGEGPASMPLHTAFGFDLTVTSLFVPLVSGGAIVVYPEPESGVDLSVLQVFEDDAVDVVKLTPAHLALVVAQARAPVRIRSLILGGEDLKTALARRAVDVLGERVTLFNEYGPTEAIVGCMRHRFDTATDTDLSVPIGVAAEGVEVYVLDEGMNPVPDGVEGELYVGGHRLARGYLGRDDLTAERFLADPFRPGGRVYRTGDRARVTRGLLEYRGRSDDQVKIRGVRVETAEVEQVLRDHPAVRSCVVGVVGGGRRHSDAEERHCVRCGLSSHYPGTTFDAEGLCRTCRDLEGYRDRVAAYFRSMEELREALGDAAARRAGPWDCLMLLSGGKDSTYALYQVARLTPRILTMTLDNGYISDGAKANIRRAVEALGLEHRFVTAPGMNQILVDSLKRHSNVCNGCFKALYTLAIQTALDEGIPAIVTGLSRGQFFETRLTPELFLQGPLDLEAVDRSVLEARKAYHRLDDAVSECLDVSAVRRDDTFEKVKFIDFYRYCDVSVDEVYRFLDEHAPWTRPSDTGRSTNCLINDVGIYVHRRREGFHNYALPYSWDVRLGHKTRDLAMDELDDEIDARRVAHYLGELGYDENVFEPADETRLAAWFTADEALSPSDLRAHLAERLIEPMIPGHLVQVDEIPLTANGKVDRAALPDPRAARPATGPGYRPPRTAVEKSLCDLWSQVLEVGAVGLDDDFHDLGGDSIAAIQIAARAKDRGLEVAVSDLSDHPTVARLAEHVGPGAGTPARPSAKKRALKPFELANLDAAGLDRVARLLDKRRGDG